MFCNLLIIFGWCNCVTYDFVIMKVVALEVTIYYEEECCYGWVTTLNLHQNSDSRQFMLAHGMECLWQCDLCKYSINIFLTSKANMGLYVNIAAQYLYVIHCG